MKNNYAVGISLALILFGVISGFIAAILSITQHSRTQRLKDKQVELRAQIEEKQIRTTELISRVSPLLRNLDERTIVFEAIEAQWGQYQQKRRIQTGLIEKRKVLEAREILKSRFNTELTPILTMGPATMIREQLKEFLSVKSKLRDQ